VPVPLHSQAFLLGHGARHVQHVRIGVQANGTLAFAADDGRHTPRNDTRAACYVEDALTWLWLWRSR
jgi:hypothetical protein